MIESAVELPSVVAQLMDLSVGMEVKALWQGFDFDWGSRGRFDAFSKGKRWWSVRDAIEKAAVALFVAVIFELKLVLEVVQVCFTSKPFTTTRDRGVGCGARLVSRARLPNVFEAAEVGDLDALKQRFARALVLSKDKTVPSSFRH